MTSVSDPAATQPALPPDMPAAVRAAFARFAEPDREQLLNLRDLVLAVAAETEGVGALEETLKWGQISYLTPQTKSGTTIRIDVDEPGLLSLYVNCRTTLIDQIRSLYGPQFVYEGTRCIRFTLEDPRDIEAVEHCIALALTYHLSKRRSSAGTFTHPPG